jgi:hypothetical protein
MTVRPPLADDIAYAISCVQDHRDTIDTDIESGQKLSDNATRVINRLLSFYYQLKLTGYDPTEKNKWPK